jgi:plastocyanin
MTHGLRRPVCLALILVVPLVLPSVADAARKSVDMGIPRAAQRSFQSTGSDVNDFFPHRVTIHVGDTVRFVPTGFHTVDLPGRRTRKLPIITPTNQTVSGVLDAAGAPFFFNGQPALGFNPRLLRSGFGKRRAYNGRRAVLSGLPVQRNPRPMSVRFTRAGSFRYFCDIHPGMTGTVRVVRAGRSVPSARQDRATLRSQVARTLRTARSLASGATPPPAGTVDVGRQGAGGVSFFAFVPAQLTVPRGSVVTFRMAARSEVHTATTGPGNPESEPNSYLGQIAASLQRPVFDPRAVYPSDPVPSAPLTPTFHGNGFWNSGGLDLDPATPTVPDRNTVQFAAPGTYEVYCMIHPFMHATVTVT